MPRKRRVKDSPATDLPTAAEILSHSPVAQLIEAHEAKTRVEPEHQLPEPPTPEQEALAAFQRQREREQAVTEPPSPERARPQPPTRWADTVRGLTSHGKDTGVHHIMAKIPIGDLGVMDVVGIKFDKGKHRTDEEKREMEAIGLGFRKDLGAWVKPKHAEPVEKKFADAFEETQDMALRFANRRRQSEAEMQR